MPDLAVACSIDDRPWSREQLAMVEYDRHRHVLHEMKRLGATIELTHEDIDFLNAADARTACVTARQSYGVDGITELYGDDYALLNPDHYFIEEDGDGMHAMETFGMYGAPTEMHLVADPAIPVPVEPAAGYQILTAGSTTLASDGTDINVLAFHQYKPLENGFAVKLGSLYPATTPRQIVEGHKVHMAIEFRSMCELATGADAGSRSEWAERATSEGEKWCAETNSYRATTTALD